MNVSSVARMTFSYPMGAYQNVVASFDIKKSWHFGK
jgi:hypothetical protein